MKVTIQVDDQLLSEVRKLADERGQTMTAVVEEVLRRMLAEQQHMLGQPPVELITVSGYGLQPGVDLDDSADLLDLMHVSEPRDSYSLAIQFIMFIIFGGGIHWV